MVMTSTLSRTAVVGAGAVDSFFGAMHHDAGRFAHDAFRSNPLTRLDGARSAEIGPWARFPHVPFPGSLPLTLSFYGAVHPPRAAKVHPLTVPSFVRVSDTPARVDQTPQRGWLVVHRRLHDIDDLGQDLLIGKVRLKKRAFDLTHVLILMVVDPGELADSSAPT